MSSVLPWRSTVFQSVWPDIIVALVLLVVFLRSAIRVIRSALRELPRRTSGQRRDSAVQASPGRSDRRRTTPMANPPRHVYGPGAGRPMGRTRCRAPGCALGRTLACGLPFTATRGWLGRALHRGVGGGVGRRCRARTHFCHASGPRHAGGWPSDRGRLGQGRCGQVHHGGESGTCA